MSLAEAEHVQLFCNCQSSQSNNLFQVTFVPRVAKQEVLPIIRETDWFTTCPPAPIYVVRGHPVPPFTSPELPHLLLEKQ